MNSETQLKRYLQDPHSVQWGTNDELVQEIHEFYKQLKWSSHDLMEAHERAKDALNYLRKLTESKAEILKYVLKAASEKLTGLEAQVPLHVDDEAASVEPRQPLDALDVACDEAELLSGV